MKVLWEKVSKPGVATKVSGALELEGKGGKEYTVDDVKAAFAKFKPRYYASRQEWRLAPKAGEKRGESLKGSRTLASYGLGEGATIYFKDLGPQIGYSTVFFWEYFGPMVLYPIFYAFPEVFYGAKDASSGHHLAQDLACAYWVFHYAKRIFETFFVHRFSHGTMPLRNLVKNCSYYWGYALLVSYFLNHPMYTAPTLLAAFGDNAIYACFGLALLCQWANFRCHVLLTRLRKPGETAYKIPRGFLFEFITCPNYTAEILGWLFFNIGTQTLMGYAFMLSGAFQMYLWAVQKHKRLRRQFDGKDGRPKYPRRWIIMPPFA